MAAKRETFTVVVERDEEGYYVATVPALPGCHTQAKSLDKLTDRIREAIVLCLRDEPRPAARREFIAVQQVRVA
jgi:predicted RNase H-like HicB family nuclease